MRGLWRQLAQPVGLAGTAAMAAVAVTCLLRAGGGPEEGPAWLFNENNWLYLACALVVAESASRRLPAAHPLQKVNRAYAPRFTRTGAAAFRLLWYGAAFFPALLLGYFVLIAVQAIERTQPVPGLWASPADRALVSHGAARDAMLAAAVMRHDVGRVRMLLRRGADPNARLEDAREFFPAAGSGRNITVLEEATRSGDTAIAALLVQAGGASVTR